jgi:hypothetical protein
VRNSTDYYQDAVDWLLGHGDPSALDRVLEGSQRAGRSSFFTDIVARLKKPWSEKTAEELAAEVDAFIGSGCIREALQAVERALKTYPDDPKLRTKQCIAQAHSLREAPI